jgi:polysaccharide export outer membrane protein
MEMEALYNEASPAHPVKTFFSAQAVLAAVFAASGLTAGAQTKPSGENHAAVAADGIPEAVDPHTYQIGPEDVLFLRVWREPDFTFPVAVRPDGKITIPLVGEVDAAGETPTQLTDDLTARLGKYINHPDVSVSVTDVRSKKYYIDGEVNRPGSFALVTRTTVLEALSHSGGFKDFANTKKIRILRSGKIYFFNFRQVTSAKHLEQNIVVENGDHIIVP